MKHLLPVLLLALSYAPHTAAQSTGVYLQLANGLTSKPSQPLRVTNNIGQQFHTFVVLLSGNGSCSNNAVVGYSFSANVEVSYNGKQYFTTPQTRIAVRTIAYQNTSSKLYSFAGTFPWIQLTVTNFPGNLPPGCTVSVSYSGAVYPIITNDMTGENLVAYSANVGTGCTALLTPVNVDPNSRTGYVVVGLATVNTTATAVNITLYQDSACSIPEGTIVSPANASLVLPDDLLLGGILEGGPTSPQGGVLGLWAKSSSAGPVSVRALLQVKDH